MRSLRSPGKCPNSIPAESPSSWDMGSRKGGRALAGQATTLAGNLGLNYSETTCFWVGLPTQQSSSLRDLLRVSPGH